MKRIVIDVIDRTSLEIFDELRSLFNEEDYTAATTNFDSNNNPREVVIVTHNDAVETYLNLKYFGTDGTQFLSLVTEEEKLKLAFIAGFTAANQVDKMKFEEDLKTINGIDLEAEIISKGFKEFTEKFPDLNMLYF